MCCAYASVGCGLAANLLIGISDARMAATSQAAAQIIDPKCVVLPTCNWYFIVAACVVLTLIATFVTESILEPRMDLGTGHCIELCNKYPNLFYDLCSPVNKRYGALRMVDRELNPDKAIYGTDGPWNDPAVSLGSVILSGIDPKKLDKWFSGNFLGLYKRAAAVLK